MTARHPVPITALALLAVLAACGGGEAAEAETAEPDSAARDAALAEGSEPRGHSAEETHSGAYLLIEEAESAVEDANRRTREMDSRLGDL